MNSFRELQAQYITDEIGDKTAVIVPIKKFEELLEDIEDLVALLERRDEETVSFEDVLQNLRKNGLLQD